MRKLIALALLVPTLAWGAIWLTVKEPTASVAGPNEHFDTEITRLGGSVLQKCACRSTADKTTFVLGANQGDISYNATLDGMEFNMPATGRDSASCRDSR